jgi:holo-[acyl-carrier protein] synthase
MSERVIGTGIDIVEVARIADSIERHGQRFLERIFHPDEVAYSQQHKIPAVHLAARFSAKEAISKAFGTGIGKSLGWKDMEVCRHPHGEPFVKLHDKGITLAQERGVAKVLISLSHTKEYAAASAILVGS